MRKEKTNDERILKLFKAKTQRCSDIDFAVAGIEFAQSCFIGGILSFYTTKRSEELLLFKHLLHHPALQVYLFPIAIVLEIIEVIIALVQFIEADNKNLTKLINLANKTMKASIVIPAVIIGVLGALAVIKGSILAAVPYLFVAALVVSTIFNIVASLYHGIKTLQTAKGSALRAAHKKALIENSVGIGIGMVMVCVIAAVFAAGVSSPLGLGIVAGVGIFVALGVMMFRLVNEYQAMKAAKRLRESNMANASESILSEEKSEKKETLRDEIKNALSEGATTEQIIKATHVQSANENPNIKKDRFYVRDLASVLSAAKTRKNRKRIFIKIIDAKINELAMNNKKQKNHSAAKHPQLKNINLSPLHAKQSDSVTTNSQSSDEENTDLTKFDPEQLDSKHSDSESTTSEMSDQEEVDLAKVDLVEANQGTINLEVRASANIQSEESEKISKQIPKAGQGLVSRIRLFDPFIPSRKRQAKISGLKELREIIELEETVYVSTINAISAKPEHRGIFQSFMKDKSDVRVIFDAAKQFFCSEVPVLIPSIQPS